MTNGRQIVALSGGIGGAKLAFGLSQLLADEELSVIANTGDDFEHLGLHVSPDVDTLIYTLAEVGNRETGWGRADETWSFMEALEDIGAPTWFKLGDKDLALNVFRSSELRAGTTLSDITSLVARQFGLRTQIIPMSDDPVRTMMDTDAGTLSFQEYFVHRQCNPVVNQIRFDGVERARPSPGLQALLADPGVGAYVVCPSNPYLSIDPIIALPGVRAGIAANRAPVVAVSPVVAGESLKGPTGKIMTELGVACTATAVARHYQGLIDGMIIDDRDASLVPEIERTGVRAVTTSIVMNSASEKVSLAEAVLSFADQLV